MDFGQAITAAKEGKLISREGWNGKGMFVFQRPADALPLSMLIENVKSLPQSVKDYYAEKFPKVYCEKPENRGKASIWPVTNVPFGAYFCMKAADDSIVNGWLASQTDMLATDWGIVA